MIVNQQQEAVFKAFSAWQRGEFELAPVTGLLHVSPLEIAPGLAVVSMPAARDLHNVFGSVHGGLLCALADVAMGIALATELDHEAFTTLQQSMDHLRRTGDTPLVARAEVARKGKRSAHLTCAVEQDGKAVATATSVCLVYPLTPPAPSAAAKPQS